MFGSFKIRDSRNASVRNAPIWAFLTGETYASAVHAHRRPHRGMLPDVDFSRAVAQARRPSLLQRIALQARALDEPTEAIDDLVGEMRSGYIADVTLGDSDNRVPAGHAVGARAA